MSVRKADRRQGDFEVITAAEALVKYTIEITTNGKNFPKRYRWCLTNKIVENATAMFADLSSANNIKVSRLEDKKLRRSYQVRALAEIGAMLALMHVAYDVFHVDADRAEYWTRLVKNEQTLIRKWRDSDDDRYKDVE